MPDLIRIADRSRAARVRSFVACTGIRHILRFACCSTLAGEKSARVVTFTLVGQATVKQARRVIPKTASDSDSDSDSDSARAAARFVAGSTSVAKTRVESAKNAALCGRVTHTSPHPHPAVAATPRDLRGPCTIECPTEEQRRGARPSRPRPQRRTSRGRGRLNPLPAALDSCGRGPPGTPRCSGCASPRAARRGTPCSACRSRA
jgi:hypothetical protein